MHYSRLAYHILDMCNFCQWLRDPSWMQTLKWEEIQDIWERQWLDFASIESQNLNDIFSLANLDQDIQR